MPAAQKKSEKQEYLLSKAQLRVFRKYGLSREHLELLRSYPFFTAFLAKRLDKETFEQDFRKMILENQRIKEKFKGFKTSDLEMFAEELALATPKEKGLLRRAFGKAKGVAVGTALVASLVGAAKKAEAVNVLPSVPGKHMVILDRHTYDIAREFLPEGFIIKYQRQLYLISKATGNDFDIACAKLPKDLMENYGDILVAIAQETGHGTAYAFETLPRDLLPAYPSILVDFAKLFKAKTGDVYKVIPRNLFKIHPHGVFKAAELAEEATVQLFDYLPAFIHTKDDLDTALQIWEANKRYFGITHFHRYFGTDLLEYNLLGRYRHHMPGKRVGVMVNNRNDETGAFASRHHNKQVDKLRKGYKISLYEANHEDGVFTALKDTYERSGKKVSLLILGGHGNQFTLQLGKTGKTFESVFLDLTDAKQFKRYEQFLTRDVIIILLSCETGKGKEFEKNLANAIKKALPDSSLYAPTDRTHLEKFTLDRRGEIIAVVFGSETYVALADE
ncbi:hypothetical protein KY349_02920 [Candidatus Woesearchaeota archaeon]|nr:hypothetical protein [Candidatus Woesearchaeota archaeon]